MLDVPRYVAVLRAAFASATTAAGFYYLAVARVGAAPLTNGSRDSEHHVKPCFGKLVLLHQAWDWQREGSVPVQPYVVETSWQPKPLPPLSIHQSLHSIGMGYCDLVDCNLPHKTGQQTKLKAPQLQLPGKSSAVLFEATDSILPELLYLLVIFEVCIVPTSKAFHGLLQDCWYWFTIDTELLIGEPALDNGDTVGFAGFNLHSCLDDDLLEFIQQAFGACFCYRCHVIHIRPNWRKTQAQLLVG